MGCRRMLSVEDRAAIMAGLEAGLSQTRIAHLIGRSPSVVCREIARHRGPGGVYQAEDAGRAAQVARRRPKKRLLDRDEILRRRVIFDLSQGRTPRQISGRLSVEACGTVAPMDNSPHAQGRTISHEAIYTWIYAHPKKTLIEHGVCLPSRRWMRKKPPAGGRTPPIVGMRLIDERPDIADRMIPGNWEGDLIIGKDGASACATLVERTTRYLIIVALPLGRRADQVCDALTRRIQGLPEGAMRTLTWDQGREMARHQHLTQDTGVEVFFAHPHSPWERGTNENTNRLIRRYLPKGTPITSHQPYLDTITYEPGNCPEPPSATTPPQKHSTNSLLPPIDTAVIPLATLPEKELLHAQDQYIQNPFLHQWSDNLDTLPQQELIQNQQTDQEQFPLRVATKRAQFAEGRLEASKTDEGQLPFRVLASEHFLSHRQMADYQRFS